MIPIHMAKKYCKNELTLANFLDTFPNVGIFSSEIPSQKDTQSVFANMGDFLLLNVETRFNSHTAGYIDPQNEIMFIKYKPIREMDEDQAIRVLPLAIKMLNKANHFQAYVLGHFNLLNDLHKRNALPDGMIVFDWSNALQHKKVLAYNKNSREVEVIDFRGLQRDPNTEYGRFDDKHNTHRYNLMYSTFTNKEPEDFDNSDLVQLQFEWYYKPILSNLNIIEDSFKV